MLLIGFEVVEGMNFIFKINFVGVWDGIIYCCVLEVVLNQCFVYVWKGGDESNSGYGLVFDMVVIWFFILVEVGMWVCVVYLGFVMLKNDIVYCNMSEGWVKVLQWFDVIVGDDN